MQKQQKELKLEPLAPKDLLSNYNKNNNPTHRDEKLNKKFRLRDALSQKNHKTQGSVQNMHITRKSSRIKSEFSEQYMTLVNKLKVNLSKKSFTKNDQSTPYLYLKSDIIGDQNRPRQYSNRQQLNQLFMKTNNRYDETSKANQNYKWSSESLSKKIQLEYLSREKTNLSMNQKDSMLAEGDLRKKNKYFTDELSQINEKKEHQAGLKRDNLKKKVSLIKEERKRALTKPNEIYNQIENQNIHQSQNKQINLKYSKIEQLTLHIEIIMQIYEAFNHQEDLVQNQITLIKILKEYTLGNKKTLVLNGKQKVINDDISHLDDILVSDENRKEVRNFIFLQRILIIGCIDLMANKRFDRYIVEINQVLFSILGFYIYLVSSYRQVKGGKLSEYCQDSLLRFQKKVYEYNIHLKRQLQTTNQFIFKRLAVFLKSNQVLFEQIKILITQFSDRNVTINRSFYEILKLYAIHLNNNENLIERNYQMLRTFATCPSPYLMKSVQKIYTLVLDLDQTLLHTTHNKNKLEIFLRPYVKEFLQVLSKNYQIVIFTSSLPQYSQEIIKQLPFISHSLYRYHTTRLKNRYIKDLSRIGRNLQKTIIVDNEEDNFVLQKNNGIKISDWTGDNAKDQQLNILGVFLNELATKKIEDVRNQIPNYKQFRKKYL